MNYIAHRRYKGTAFGNSFNIPALTELTEQDGNLFYQGKLVCTATSYIAHQFFARNDDGDGLLRGKLTQAIQNTLAKRKSRNDPEYQARWDKVWADSVCQPFKKAFLGDDWIWNHEFYNAPVLTLRHIAGLVGAKEG